MMPPHGANSFEPRCRAWLAPARSPARPLFLPLSPLRILFLALLAVLLPAAAQALCAPAPAMAALVIVDDAGQKIALAAPARRIIPLYAGLGEILAAMGLQERLVGRTASDEAQADGLPVVGTHMRPNPETILGLAPDLVVQFEGREEAALLATRLQALGLRVARFRIASFEELFACLRRLGLLCGAEEKAAALERDWRARLQNAAQRVAGYQGKPRIFFEVRYPNLLGAGAGGMAHAVIEQAGGSNCLAAHAGRMVRLGEEALLAADPDIYLLQQGAMNKNPLPLEKRQHFQGLSALRQGFVWQVKESLYSRPGPGSIEAVEELAEKIAAWHAARRHSK
ncbi:ABC transporter substrate-binding protein [Desulfovibrio sp. OttesenSCG-928-G11]|nr:ABC transporter substrate-binding protein [Desulfovibrio sp. OttesenSCG-928-G11]